MALWTPPISDPSKLQLVHTVAGWHSLAYPFGQKPEPAIDRFLTEPLNGVPCKLGESAIVRRQEAPLTLLLDGLTINQPVPLHDFQAAAEDAYLTARRHGRDRGLIVIPTGGGKTTTFTHIVGQIFLEQQQLQNEWRAASQTRLFGTSTAAFLGKWQAPAKTLVVVHTEEILDQNVAELVQVLGSEERVGRVQTRRFQQWDRPVVVVSIQTLIAMDPEERQGWLRQFGQVVLDEAHHYVFGNDWFVPLIEMGFFDSEGNITWNWPKGLLGVTATTDRYTGLPLRTTFGPDGIVYSIDMVPLIEKRVLVEPYGIEVRVTTSKTDDPIRALKELSPQEKADLVLAIFKDRLHLPAEGRYLKTRVFVDNMDDLPVLVERLNAAGIKAVGITGDQVYGPPMMGTHMVGTPMDRKSAIEAYGSGQFDALVTIKVGIEGHNDPGTEAGILVLSSDSRGSVIQRIGRLLRHDPLHPERREAIIVDCGLNLERHDLGISAREAYDLDDGGLVARTLVGGGVARTPGTGLIDAVAIKEKGDLLNTRPYPYFAQALRQFLKTPEEVERLSFAVNSNSDRLFQYWNGLALPGSLKEVEELARLIQDPLGMIVDAWAWEKVQEREKTFPLLQDLSEEERSLAQWFRFGVFRWFGGSMEAALDTSQRMLAAFWSDGSIPLHNQPRMPLTLFYDRVAEIVSGPRRPDLKEIISALIPEVIRVKWQWQQELTALPLAWRWLLGFAREAFITSYRGEPLMSGPGSIEQQDPIRPFVYDKTVPKGSRSMQGLCESLLGLLAGDDPAAQERVNFLLDEGIRESRELQGPFQEVRPKMAAFHAWALQGMIRRQRGFVPSQYKRKIVPYQMRNELITFYRRRRLPESLMVKGFARFSFLVLEFSSAGDPRSLAEGKQLLQDALVESCGWDQPIGLLPTVGWLLALFRSESIRRYQGSWPTTGLAGLETRSLIRRFLEQGEKIAIQDYLEELLRVLSEGDAQRRAEWTPVLQMAAAEQAAEKSRRQLGLDQELPQLAAPIQALRHWLQQQLLAHPERIASLQPSHYAFLQTGDLSDFYGRYTRHMFYDDLLRAGAGDDVAEKEQGNLLIRAALKEKLGWTEAHQKTLQPAVARTLDRYFDIVCDKHRSVIPDNDNEIPRGSNALRNLVDLKDWPQFRGTNARNAATNFQASLRRFFLDNGVSETEANRLIEDAAAFSF